MAICVIVMGGGGRMGGTIARLVQDALDLELKAVLEQTGNIDKLAGFACLKSDDLAKILPQAPGAVIIDFTAPAASLAAARLAAAHGNPIIIGTTGLDGIQLAELAKLAEKNLVFQSPNMSVGINVLLEVLPKLVQLLGEPYDIELMEIHHNRKKDAPSGTALRLAEALAEARNWNLKETATYCREGLIGERPHEEIGVQTLRGGDVVGVHTAYFMGPGERIEVTHQAHSRENFANGALRAVRWLISQKPGRIYNMQDCLRG